MRRLFVRLYVMIALVVAITGAATLLFIDVGLQPERDRAIAHHLAKHLSKAPASWWRHPFPLRKLTPEEEQTAPTVPPHSATVLGEGLERRALYRDARVLWEVPLWDIYKAEQLWLHYPWMPPPAMGDDHFEVRQVALASLTSSQRKRLLSGPIGTASSSPPFDTGVMVVSDATPDAQAIWFRTSRRNSRIGRIVLVFGLVLILAGGIAVVLRPIRRDLTQLHDAALALGAGDLSSRAHLVGDGPTADVGNAFDGMADRISRLLRSREVMLQAVAHELRNPISKLGFAVHLLRSSQDNNGANDAEPKQALDDIAAASAQIESFTDEVLQFVRLSDDAEQEGMSLSAVVEQVKERAGDDLAVDVVQPDGNGDTHISMPASVFRRVLRNLIDNATAYGGGQVLVRLKPGPEHLLLEVHDDGQPTPAPSRARWTEPFVRGDESRNRETGGLGIGLSLVQQSCVLFGAELSITDSDKLGGTQCTIRFSFVRSDEDDSTSTSTSTSA